MPSISDPHAADVEASSTPLDPMGWAFLAAGLLVALIGFSLLTAMSISSNSTTSGLISKSEFLSSLPPWRLA
jgi:hypothetical protein